MDTVLGGDFNQMQDSILNRTSYNKRRKHSEAEKMNLSFRKNKSRTNCSDLLLKQVCS